MYYPSIHMERLKTPGDMSGRKPELRTGFSYSNGLDALVISYVLWLLLPSYVGVGVERRISASAWNRTPII
jgi:hypothetical protein